MLDEISNIIKYKKIELKKNRYSEYIYNKVKEYPNIEVINMIYKSDKLKIHGFISKKKNLKKKVPVVIYCRGGNNININKKTGRKLGELIPLSIFFSLSNLVNDGKIILFASNYRGSSLSEGKDEFGGNDINDIINLYPIIKKYKYSDEKNICLYGWSRGCSMVMNVHKKVKWIKCIILGAGNYNYFLEKKFRPKMYKMLKTSFSLSEEDLKKRSAIYWIDKLKKNVPILILHGSADWRVSVDNAYLLGQALQKNKIPYKLVIYPGGDHGLLEYKKEVALEKNNFLESYLLDNKQKYINLDNHGN